MAKALILVAWNSFGLKYQAIRIGGNRADEGHRFASSLLVLAYPHGVGVDHGLAPGTAAVYRRYDHVVQLLEWRHSMRPMKRCVCYPWERVCFDVRGHNAQ